MAEHRVYHWKHGWIPLDHPAAVEAIAHSAGTSDRAAGRLSGPALAQAHRHTDSKLQAAVQASKAADRAQMSNALREHRAAEAARVRLTHADIAGATHVRDRHGWHEVVRVNAKSVTVKTPHSWTDSLSHDKILEVRRPSAQPSEAETMMSKVSETQLISMGQGSYKETKQIVNAELRRRWTAESDEHLQKLLMSTRIDQAQKNIIRAILAAR